MLNWGCIDQWYQRRTELLRPEGCHYRGQQPRRIFQNLYRYDSPAKQEKHVFLTN